MALPDDPADRHAAVAGGFGRLVAQTTDWSAPAPVDGWTARDVVGHLVGWFPPFLAGGGVDLPAGPSADDDPVAAWRHHADAVQALVEERGQEPFTHPRAGSHRLADAVDRFYTADVFMHSWDLARAGGHEPGLDEDYAGRLLEGMRPIEQLLRDSGQYGPAVPVPDDAPVVDRLMGFVGRDPSWRAGTGGTP
ncbi:maleylpyruvate isomerase family mycothiol-dependent enzyme [Nocardioides sp. T5]|uniref:maleylpyruvate isomerase family mycothiol-dependent enzyme n=1 Tax=Nocardioides sp. T5 TaxID=3400182 RepID=UPI003A83B578